MQPFMRSFTPGIAGLCLLLSCGAKTTAGTGSDQADAHEAEASCPEIPARLSSLEAVEAGRCWLKAPKGSALWLVHSAAPVRSDGLAMMWGLGFIDPAAHQAYKGYVAPLDPTELDIDPLLAIGKAPTCQSEAGTASSKLIIPDAVKRFTDYGLLASGADAALSYWETGDCEGLSKAGVKVWYSDSNEPGTWYADYDLAGQFRGICGPCEKGSDKPCEC